MTSASDRIDVGHPTRAVLALLAVALGAPAVVVHQQTGELLDHSSASASSSMTEPDISPGE